MTRTLQDAAWVVGGHVWLEERLFEVLGGWVPTVPEAEVKLRLAADSRHHAWHGSLWRERLPALREMEAQQFVAPRRPALEAFMTALQSAPGTIERLAGLYRVLLPHQVGAYQRQLAQATPISDGPTIRTLQLVLADELTDWQQGERLIQQLLVSAGEVQRASAQQAQLETLLIIGGGGRESNPPDGDHPSQPL